MKNHWGTFQILDDIKFALVYPKIDPFQNRFPITSRGFYEQFVFPFFFQINALNDNDVDDMNIVL